MEPKSPPGPSWEGEISLGNSPGDPPEDHNDIFGSGGLRLREGMFNAVLVVLPPGSSGERFWSHFGSLWARIWSGF